MKKNIRKIIEDKCELLKALEVSGYIDEMMRCNEVMLDSLQKGGKIIIAGNGGSAADAQHFAGELMGKYFSDRKAIPAISLCVDPSVMTCIGNDYGYEKCFSRQIEGLGKKEDVFVAISTSGNSENIVQAILKAKEKAIKCIGLLGNDGGKIGKLCEYKMIVPSCQTPRIQEVHIFTIHMLCDTIERELARNGQKRD